MSTVVPDNQSFSWRFECKHCKQYVDVDCSLPVEFIELFEPTSVTFKSECAHCGKVVAVNIGGSIASRQRRLI